MVAGGGRRDPDIPLGALGLDDPSSSSWLSPLPSEDVESSLSLCALHLNGLFLDDQVCMRECNLLKADFGHIGNVK